MLRALILLSCVGLAGCTAGGRNGETNLHSLSTAGAGPDEFSIVPHRPLVQPESFAELPAPTPGRRNRADAIPDATAIAALGGDPSRLNSTGVPSSDTAMLNRATRFGIDANIRRDLAIADVEFRRTRGRFNYTIIADDRYSRVYSRLSLDPYRQIEVFRRLGVKTPAAPPIPE